MCSVTRIARKAPHLAHHRLRRVAGCCRAPVKAEQLLLHLFAGAAITVAACTVRGSAETVRLLRAICCSLLLMGVQACCASPTAGYPDSSR